MVSTAQERAALVIRNRNKRNEEMTYKVGYDLPPKKWTGLSCF